MINILIGKSASGKDTILNKLINGEKVEGIDISGRLNPIISYTTRPMRDGEVNGREYRFIDKDRFLNLIETDDILEYRKYDTLVNGIKDTWYYGTPVVDIDKDNYIVIVDIQGCKAFLHKYGNKNCRVWFIVASDEVRTNRAIHRGSFDRTEWNRRLEDDNKKFSDSEINTLKNICADNFFVIYNDKNMD